MDILILSPFKIWIRAIVISGIASSDVRTVHALLRERAKYVLRRSSGLIRFSDSLIQHFNPACRAARAFPELPISRLLMSLNDHDLPIKYVHIDNYRRGFDLFYYFGALTGFTVALVMFFLTAAPEIMQDSLVEVGITAAVNLSVLAMGVMSDYSTAVPVGFMLCLVVLILVREKLSQNYAKRLPNFFHPVPAVTIFEEAAGKDEDEKITDEIKKSMRARYEEISYRKRRNAIYHGKKSDSKDVVIHQVRKIKGLKEKSLYDDDYSDQESVTRSRVFVASDEYSIKIPICDGSTTRITEKRIEGKSHDSIVIKPSVLVKKKLGNISLNRIIGDAATSNLQNKVHTYDDATHNVTVCSKESIVSLYRINQSKHEIKEVPSGIVIKDTRPSTVHSRQKSSQNTSMSQQQIVKNLPLATFDDFISSGYLEMSKATTSVVNNSTMDGYFEKNETYENQEINSYCDNNDDHDNSTIATTETFHTVYRTTVTPSKLLLDADKWEEVEDIEDIEDVEDSNLDTPNVDESYEQSSHALTRQIRREALFYSRDEFTSFNKPRRSEENLVDDSKATGHFAVNIMDETKQEFRIDDNDDSTVSTIDDYKSIETTFLDDRLDSENTMTIDNTTRRNDNYSIKSNKSLDHNDNESIYLAHEALHEIELISSGIVIRNIRPKTSSKTITSSFGSNDDLSFTSTQSRPLTSSDLMRIVRSNKKKSAQK